MPFCSLYLDVASQASQTGLVSFAENPRHGPERGIETSAQRYEPRAHIQTLVVWPKPHRFSHSEAALVAVTEIRPTGAYDCAGSPARGRRSFRCKGSVDLVLYTELAGS